MLWMEAFAVMAIGDVNPFIASDGVRVDGSGRMNAMLPFFLHLRVHDEQRIVWKMNCDLAFSVGSEFIFGFQISALDFTIISGHNLANPELSRDTETEAANDCSWTKICELVRVIAYALAAAFVAIDKGGVRYPLLRRLILEFFSIFIMIFDPFLDLHIYGCSDRL